MSENKTSWTDEQKSAINTVGKQLLVAAGAGSGKTSVLTQRILKKILEGCDIDSFLIVTFTVASANDMKEKLRKKLLEEYAKDPSNAHLSKQITKLPFARISTITSFCLDIVTHNFATLNLPASLRIADEGEANELLELSLEQLMDQCFEEKDESLYKALLLSGCRGRENQLLDYLRKIYEKARAHPYYVNAIKNTTESFCKAADEFKDIDSFLESEQGVPFMEYLEEHCRFPKEEFEKMESLAEGIEKLQTKTEEYKGYFIRSSDFFKEKKYLDCASELKTSGEFAKNGWRGKIFASLEEEDQNAYKSARDAVKENANLTSKFICEMINGLENDLRLCAELMVAYKNLFIKLDKIYSNAKREKNVLDFTDAEQFAHMLLINEDNTPTELCKEMSLKIEEVLVDEYQDTNPLQDSIFSALATKDNRFMVGDDKQSIYRFRNAFPVIFNGYKSTFCTEKASCIFLRNNFRCSKEIINFTNDIFNNLWGNTYKSESLIFSKSEENPQNLPVTVKILKVRGEDGTSSKKNNKETSVFEARYIADEILSMVGKKKKDNGKYVEFSDIAILLPVVSKIAEIFADELRKKGVPAFSSRQGLLTEAPEIKLLISILKAINNPEEDIPLASAMNSFFFGFTADELVRIRKYKDSSLWGSVLRCCYNKRIFGKMRLKIKRTLRKSKKSGFFSRKNSLYLKNKCFEFVKTLKDLREKSREMECKQLLWHILENEGYLSEMEKGVDKDIRKGNVLLFYNEAITFGKREYKTLSAFLKHVGKMSSQTYSPEGMNCVSIMTIHSSKGLEFPVCFLANAAKSLSGGGGGAKMPIIDMNTGIFSPLKDEGFTTREPIFFKLAELKDKSEETAENQRKLYVALTRAKEKLYVVGTQKITKTQKDDEGKNYLSWILKSNARAEYSVEELSLEETEEQEDSTEAVISVESSSDTCKISDTFDVSDDAESFEDFIYPYMESVNIPRKLSVSALKEKSEEEYTKAVRKRDFLTVPPFAAETKKVSATEIGTANHTFMQFASFKNCVEFGVEAEADRLLMTNMITNEQYGMLNFQNLKNFFHSNLWKRISKSKVIYREKRFTVKDNSGDLLGVGNETVLVQGVIDLFFENPDGSFTVADYKTDRARPGDERMLSERYKGQLSYYAKAVKEITGKEVNEGIIYSFSLGKEITVDLNQI